MNKKNVFLFAGQGAQYPGMGKDLFDISSTARAVYETADAILGRKISEVCFTGLSEDLMLTVNTQPCMLATELAIASVLEENGLRPDVVAGFSLGEYSALVSAGVISIEAALRIIDIRARAMQAAVPEGVGAMAAVKKCPVEILEEVCSKQSSVWPVNYNSPEQTVISGLKEDVEQVVAELKAMKIRSVILPVSAPFHTPLMEPARLRLQEEFKSLEFKDARIPIYMNVDGKAEQEGRIIREKVLLQTISPVRWRSILENINRLENVDFYEIGPGSTLSAFVKKTLDRECTGIQDVEQVKAACCRA